MSQALETRILQGSLVCKESIEETSVITALADMSDTNCDTTRHSKPMTQLHPRIMIVLCWI